ncbi:Acylphosphatase [Candidatus Methanomarinus sp.]|nr:Acylphosphatase [ANME-2 cluster archaeon]
MEKCVEIVLSGRVQKAGFRDFIDEIAFNLNLNGYVKNLDDGTVQIICEGEDENIKELLKKVNITQYPIRVENIDVVYKKSTGEYRTFEIIREEDLTTATYERMDAGVRYMGEMNSNLGQKIDGVGDKIDIVGEKIDVVGKKIDIVGDKVDQNRIEITSKIRFNRDDFRSHLDERISLIEQDIAQIKEKIMLKC